MKSKSNEINDENEAMRDRGEQEGILNISYTLQYFASSPSHSLIASNEEFINEPVKCNCDGIKKFSKRTERERCRKKPTDNTAEQKNNIILTLRGTDCELREM